MLCPLQTSQASLRALNLTKQYAPKREARTKIAWGRWGGHLDEQEVEVTYSFRPTTRRNGVPKRLHRKLRADRVLWVCHN